LLGVPGTGKSAFCKALGRETDRPTIVLDVGALKGSFVGQTEERTRQALALIDRMAPSITMVDEIEKALAGVQGSGVNDSGVTAGLFGTLLSWLNDHESDTFFVATCNDISKLPPEFARAERFDGVFFLDLPGRTEKDAIWRLYLELYGVDGARALPSDTDWTGAEIKACCRLAALLDVPLVEAARNVVPVAVTASEQVERLRTWASGRYLDAHHGGIYARSIGSGGKSRREVRRGDPTPN
jgi:SpoVK/Ycf46/Vps4 family AAA+-type ATPase